MPGPFDLDGPTEPPLSGGEPRKLVVLLHGYGSDGNDLISLAPHWASQMPDAEFLSPHAPFPCEMGGFGRQWFGFEGRSADAILAGTRAAAAILDSFLDELLAARGLAERDLALVGFSQGAMMSLFVALRRPSAVAAVAGYSGRLIGDEALAGEIRAKPAVLLVHGNADQVVPYAELGRAERALKAARVPVTVETRPGLGHGIDERGLALGGAFIARAFASAKAAS